MQWSEFYTVCPGSPEPSLLAYAISINVPESHGLLQIGFLSFEPIPRTVNSVGRDGSSCEMVF